MHLAGDRHEVLDVERVGVEAAVPADHVERVRRVGQRGADDAARTVAAVLHQHLDVGALLDERLARAVQVALAVRRVLEELAEPRQVALRRRDVGVGLDRVQPRLLGRQPPMRRRARDQHVVTGAVGQHPERRLDGAGAGLDVDTLVADRVAVVRRGGRRDDVRDPHVAVAEHQPAAGHRVHPGGRACREVVQLEVARLERVVRRRALVGQVPDLAVDDRRRHAGVVEQRRVRREPLLPHQLLEPEPSLRVAMRGVPGGREVADGSVVRHVPTLPPVS